MINKRLLLTNSLIYFVLVIACYFMQNLVFFDAVAYDRSFTIQEYSIIFFIFSLIFFLTIYFEHRYNRLRPNYFFVIIMVLIFIFNAIAILTLPFDNYLEYISLDGVNYYTYLTLTMEDRIYYILQGAVMVAVTYFIFAVFPKKIHYRKQLNYLFYTILLVGLVLIIYSYATEGEMYIEILKIFRDQEKYQFEKVKSLLINGNNYGFALLLMIFAAFYLNEMRPSFFWHIVAIFMFINMLFTLCKTTIIISVFLFLIYWLYRFFATFKIHKVRNIIALSIVIYFVLIFISLSIASFYLEDGLLKIVKYFYDSIIFESSSSTLDSRAYIWAMAFEIIKNANFFFGVGLGTINNLIANLHYSSSGKAAFSTQYLHNGYLQIFANGGFVLVIASIILFAYLIYVMVKVFSKDKSIVIWTILVFLAISIYMWSETLTVMFVTSTEYVIVMVIAVVPLLARYHQIQHPYYQKEIVYFDEQKYSLEIDYNVNFPIIKTFNFFITIVLGILLATFIYLTIDGTYNCAILATIIISFLLLLFLVVVPLFFASISKSHRKKGVPLNKVFVEITLVDLVFSILSFLVTFIAFVSFDNASLSMTIIIPVVAFLTVVFVTLAIRPLIKIIGLYPFLTVFNNFYLKIFAKNIRKDDLFMPYEKTMEDAAIADQPKVLISASKDVYHLEEIISELRNRGYYVLRCSSKVKINKLEKILYKISPRLIAFKGDYYIEEIAEQALYHRFDYFLLFGGRIFDGRMIALLKDTHPLMQLISLQWNVNRRSKYFLKIFDKAYLVAPTRYYRSKKYLTTIDQFASNRYLLDKMAMDKSMPYLYFTLKSKNSIYFLKKINAAKEVPYLGYFAVNNLVSTLSNNDGMFYYYDGTKYLRRQGDAFYLIKNAEYVSLLDVHNPFIVKNYLIELLYSTKKVIVADMPALKRIDVYNPSNVYIYQGMLDYDNPFFRDKYFLLDENIYRKYNVSNFISCILSMKDSLEY